MKLMTLGLILAAGFAASAAEPPHSIFDDNWTPPSRSTTPEATSGSLKIPVTQPDLVPTQPATTQPIGTQQPIKVETVPGPIVRLEPPSAQLQSQVLKLVREIFEKEYAATDKEARKKLSRSLFVEASNIRKNQSARYVLLKEAMETAIAVGDADLASQALEAMRDGFTGDYDKLAEDTVTGLLKQVPADDLASVAWATRIAEQLVEAEQYDAAKRIALLTIVRPPTRKNPQLMERLKLVQKTTSEYDKVKPALAALKTKPEDPVANLAVAKFQLLNRADWSAALKGFAKGGQGALKEAAMKDLSDPSDAAAQFELAGLWWNLGREDQVLKARYEERAAHWYAKAQPQLQDLKSVLATKRIAEVAERTASQPAPKRKPGNDSAGSGQSGKQNLIPLINIAENRVGGNWKVEKDVLHSLGGGKGAMRLAYEPPAEYDYRLVVEPIDNSLDFRVLLSGGGREFSYRIGQDYCALDGVHEGRVWVPAHSNKTRIKTPIEISKDKPYTILAKVRKNGVAVYINDTTLIERVTDFADLGQAEWARVGAQNIGIGYVGSRFRVTSATVTDITGKGKLLVPAQEKPAPAIVPDQNNPVTQNSRVKINKPIEWDFDKPEKLQKLVLLRSWSVKPQTTLNAQRVADSLTLTKQGSPYLVKNILVIDANATLTVEPGAVVLFAPDASVENRGTIRLVSASQWIVLANAEADKPWKGIDSIGGTVTLKRCIVAGATRALFFENGRNALKASECIFTENVRGLSLGNGSSGSVEHSLLLRNKKEALIGHGDGGTINFNHCLFLRNTIACTANFYGRITGTNCTFYHDASSIEGADRGDFIRISLSNILDWTGEGIGSRGGRSYAAGNYWGKSGPPKTNHCDTGGALTAPVKEALPTMPSCEYLGLESP